MSLKWLRSGDGISEPTSGRNVRGNGEWFDSHDVELGTIAQNNFNDSSYETRTGTFGNSGVLGADFSNEPFDDVPTDEYTWNIISRNGVGGAHQILIVTNETTLENSMFIRAAPALVDIISSPWRAYSVSAFDSGGFNANNAIYPSSSPAVADSRNGHPIIAFDDTVAENVIFNSIRPENYLGEDIIVGIDWVAKTAVADDVTWGVEFERNAPGGADIDTDSFAAQQTGTSTASGTSGIITRTTIILTQAEADALEALDSYRIRLQRVVGDVGDDMAGDAQVLRVGVR